MRLIQYPNGYSPTGRQTASWLQADGLEIQTKDTFDSVVSRNGDFTTVTLKAQVGDFFLSDGYVAGQMYLAYSKTARGVFRNLPANQPVSFYGKGLGQAVSWTATTPTLDFAGTSVGTAVATMYLTRSARSYKAAYSFVHVSAPFTWERTSGTQYGQRVIPQIGEIYFDGEHRFVANMISMGLDEDGQYVPTYLVDTGTTVTQGAVVYAPNRVAAHVAPDTLGRGVRILRHTYFRTETEDGSAVPGTFFSFSTNAGVSFDLIPDPGTAFADLTTVQAYCDVTPTGVSKVRTHNYCAANVRVSTARLTLSNAVVVARVPFLDLTAHPDAFEGLRGRVRLATMDCATGVCTARSVLYTGTVDDAAVYFVALVPVEGGALLFTRDETDLTNGGGYTAPWRIRFTADGINLTDIGNMPLAGYLTGLPTALTPSRLVCPMYDGKHSLYQSDDRGATWARRATIFTGGDVPVSTHSELYMEQFSALVFLRRDNRPANPAPGAPWIHDSRLDAPL